MKNNLLVALLAVFAAFSFQACTEEEDAGNPTIQFKTDEGYTYESTEVAPGGQVLVGINATWNGTHKITNIEVFANDELIDTQGINEEEWDGNWTITKGDADEEIWVFRATDFDGNFAEVSLTLTKGDALYQTLTEINTIILGAQDNSLIGSFFSLSEETVYTVSDAASNQQKIDMLYLYDGDNENTITSAGANNLPDVFGLDAWTIKNETEYAKASITVEDFNNATTDQILIENVTSIIEDDWKAKAKKVKTDDIYYFRTHDLKYGMFKVISVSGAEEGTVNIDIKMQPFD